jgi:hypothetical protein
MNSSISNFARLATCIQLAAIFLATWQAFHSHAVLATGIVACSGLLRIGSDQAKSRFARALLRLTACGLIAISLTTNLELVLLGALSALVAERLAVGASGLEAVLAEVVFALAPLSAWALAARSTPIGTAFSCALVIWVGLPRERLWRPTRMSTQ